MEKMSITRALSEKKLLGRRIEEHFERFNPLAILNGENAPAGFKSTKEFEEYAKSAHNRLMKDLDRYDKIVQAIAQSNAITTVTIGGIHYTVARALEKKKFYMTLGNSFLKRLRMFLSQREKEFESFVEAEKVKEDREFDYFIGKEKILSEDELKITKKIIAERHKVHFIDPLGLRDILDDMIKAQNDFLQNVDIALMESNSRTEIEILNFSGLGGEGDK